MLGKIKEAGRKEQVDRPLERKKEGPTATPPAAETLESQEGGQEASREQPTKPETVVSEVSAPSASPAVAPVAAYTQKDRLTQQIESVLEEDLTDLFLTMNPAQQQEFKLKGEETISKIRQLLSQATVNTRKIFSLIRDWLKLIPGVNTFFLEQEAKIKTDKISELS